MVSPCLVGVSMEAYKTSLREAFATIDTDGSGTLTAADLVAALARPGTGGTPFTAEEAAALVKRFDANGDGVLDPEEFVEAFASLRAADATNAAKSTITPLRTKDVKPLCAACRRCVAHAIPACPLSVVCPLTARRR